MQNATAANHWRLLLKIAEQATREGHSHIRYLDALLTAELEEREDRLVSRRLFEAKIPRMRTLDDFDFKVSPISMPQIRELAEGSYLERAEPICFSVIQVRGRLI
jgi:DNA replication protein DnaC